MIPFYTIDTQENTMTSSTAISFSKEIVVTSFTDGTTTVVLNEWFFSLEKVLIKIKNYLASELSLWYPNTGKIDGDVLEIQWRTFQFAISEKTIDENPFPYPDGSKKIELTVCLEEVLEK